MKNKSILLLSMVVLLLSFFVFDGQHAFTGMSILDDDSTDADKSSSPLYVKPVFIQGETTVVYADQYRVRRGNRISFFVVPGENHGVLSQVRLLDSDGALRQYFHLCSWKVCMYPKHLTLRLSRAFPPGLYTVEFVDSDGTIFSEEIDVY
jgi:hypothetical protein